MQRRSLSGGRKGDGHVHTLSNPVIFKIKRRYEASPFPDLQRRCCGDDLVRMFRQRAERLRPTQPCVPRGLGLQINRVGAGHTGLRCLVELLLQVFPLHPAVWVAVVNQARQHLLLPAGERPGRADRSLLACLNLSRSHKRGQFRHPLRQRATATGRLTRLGSASHRPLVAGTFRMFD